MDRTFHFLLFLLAKYEKSEIRGEILINVKIFLITANYFIVPDLFSQNKSQRWKEFSNILLKKII